MVTTELKTYSDECGHNSFHARPSRRFEYGFTLIELMIVLVLVGILLGVGVPSFRSLIADQRLRAVGTDLIVGLNLTRSEAVKRNKRVVLSPSASGWQGGWKMANPVASQPDILNHILPSGVSITEGPASVTFGASGRTTAPAKFQIGINAGTDSTSTCLVVELDGRTTSTPGDCP
jgi:type IV fimbrial biogenesis protein FimT